MSNLLASALISIVTSLIASMVFSAATDGRKWKQMRPRVEFDIYEIQLSLMRFIQIGLLINECGWRYSFEKVEAGKATKEDFALWLQNKCLNDTFKYDKMGSKLLPVGDKLAACRNRLCQQIDRCATYHAFMTAEEILLLKKIATKVCIYPYEGNAETIVAGKAFRPVNPTLSYMAKNFLELSELYTALQNKIISYRGVDRTTNKYLISDFRISKARKYYLSGDFRRCIRSLKRIKKVDTFQKYSLLFKAYYCCGELEKALSALNTLLKTTTLKPISFRSVFSDMHIDVHDLDERVLDELRTHFSNGEVSNMVLEIDRERRVENTAKESAEEIASFYSRR